MSKKFQKMQHFVKRILRCELGSSSNAKAVEENRMNRSTLFKYLSPNYDNNISAYEFLIIMEDLGRLKIQDGKISILSACIKKPRVVRTKLSGKRREPVHAGTD